MPVLVLVVDCHLDIAFSEEDIEVGERRMIAAQERDLIDLMRVYYPPPPDWVVWMMRSRDVRTFVFMMCDRTGNPTWFVRIRSLDDDTALQMRRCVVISPAIYE